MGKLFGTDGIRGRVNQYPMTPEMALEDREGSGHFFSGKHLPQTRQNRHRQRYPAFGGMIESALVSGLCSMGADAYLAGVLPTPGVAHLTTQLAADAGIVVSASHNPVL